MVEVEVRAGDAVSLLYGDSWNCEGRERSV